MMLHSNALQRMRILDGLWQVGGNGFSGPADAGVYMVRFGRSAALIDTGCGDGQERLMDNIAECLPAGCRVSALLLTHCHFDHSGGARALRQAFGCPITAHHLDAHFLEQGDDRATAACWYGAEMAPLEVDIKLTTSPTDISVGSGVITAHHCPGHSPGSLVYTAQLGANRVLFGQDIHGPLHAMLRSNAIDYYASLERMLDMQADLLCEGHFGVIRGRAAVAQFIRSYLP